MLSQFPGHLLRLEQHDLDVEPAEDSPAGTGMRCSQTQASVRRSLTARAAVVGILAGPEAQKYKLCRIADHMERFVYIFVILICLF